MVCGLVGRDVIFTRRDLGYVCVILKYPDIVQLLNAPLPVVRAVHLVCQRLRASCILRRGDDSTNMSVQDAAQRAREDTPLMHKYGCSVEMALGGYVFVRDNALRASAVGKQFTMKLFATMDELGYDFFLSSNLSTARGGCGAMTVKPAWFFVHRIKLARRATKSDLNVTIPRSRLRPSPTIYRSSVDNPATPLKIVCIEPRAHDQLHLFGADESVIEGVKMAIADAWPKGIKSEIREVTLGGDVILLQLHGFPWFTNREDEWEHPNLSRAHVNVQAKRLLVHIVGELARIHYKYVTATNLMGVGDTYIFVYDSCYVSNPDFFCAITLDYNNRMRLIKCAELFTQISMVIDEYYSPVLHHTLGRVFAERAGDPSLAEDVHEFTLRHLPWHYSVTDKTQPNTPAQVALLSAVVGFMSVNGCRLLGSMRTAEDRSALLFHHDRRRISMEASAILEGLTQVASISLLGSNELHLRNMSPPVVTTCMDVAYMVYKSGIKTMKREDVEDSGAYFLLRGEPWKNADDICRVHAVNLIMFLVAAAQDSGFNAAASVEICGVEGKEDTENGIMQIVLIKS
eukprot:GEMP01019086.1.p1 GENE.GEMP01019086.1~~GEMP01019086.1.p1  ORF type:complete len:572 (+),score=126.61 GEMP01019086.1:34-1749(+)